MSDTIESLRQERDAARAEVATLKALLGEVRLESNPSWDGSRYYDRISLDRFKLGDATDADWIARRDAACRDSAPR
jgi:hypothetical protein